MNRCFSLLCLIGLSLGFHPVIAQNVKQWTITTKNGRQHLVTPEGKPFLVLGLSHASGAWQGLLGPRKQQALENLKTDLREDRFKVQARVLQLGQERVSLGAGSLVEGVLCVGCKKCYRAEQSSRGVSKAPHFEGEAGLLVRQALQVSANLRHHAKLWV